MGWPKWRIRYGDDIRWSYGRTRSLGSSVLVRCLNLNSANGILQGRTLTVEVCFVKRTLAKQVRLHGAYAIVDRAPGFKSIRL